VRRAGEPAQRRLVRAPPSGEDGGHVAAGQPVQEQRHRLGRVLQIGVQADPHVGVLDSQPGRQRGVLPDVDRQHSQRDPVVLRLEAGGDGGAVVG
jgi:hypothetical protein